MNTMRLMDTVRYSISHKIRTWFCCALFCCGYIIGYLLIYVIHLLISFRVASLALGQSYSASEVTLKDMGKMNQHQTTTKHNKAQITWWRHQMETFSALLALCAGNSPVTGKFPSQRPVMKSFDVFFDLRPNKRLNKQSWGWWFETPSCSL